MKGKKTLYAVVRRPGAGLVHFMIERHLNGYAVRFKRFGLFPTHLGKALGLSKRPKLYTTRRAAIDAFMKHAGVIV